MTESLLPNDAQGLFDLIASGEMSASELDELIVQHAHLSCELCDEIYEDFSDYTIPLELLVEHNQESLSLQNRENLYEIILSNRLQIGDIWGEIFTRKGVLVDLATGPSANRSLLHTIAEDHEYLAQIFRAEDDDDDFETVTRKIALKLAGHPECDAEVIRTIVEKFHDYGNWCLGKFEACDRCIDIIEDTEKELK